MTYNVFGGTLNPTLLLLGKMKMEMWDKKPSCVRFNCLTIIIITVLDVKYLEVTRCYCCYSMGGHGALVCHLKNPGMYKSVSAMAPICNPSQCPWGLKAFEGYLGSDQTSWAVRMLSVTITNQYCCLLILLVSFELVTAHNAVT